jgi:hypothetical protein
MIMILLNENQAEQIRSNYGTYSALDPIKVTEGYALPADIIGNIEFASIKEYLKTLPIQEVTFIISDEEII